MNKVTVTRMNTSYNLCIITNKRNSVSNGQHMNLKQKRGERKIQWHKQNHWSKTDSSRSLGKGLSRSRTTGSKTSSTMCKSWTKGNSMYCAQYLYFCYLTKTMLYCHLEMYSCIRTYVRKGWCNDNTKSMGHFVAKNNEWGNNNANALATLWPIKEIGPFVANERNRPLCGQ